VVIRVRALKGPKIFRKQGDFDGHNFGLHHHAQSDFFYVVWILSFYSRNFMLLTRMQVRVTLSYMDTLTIRIPDELKADLQRISQQQKKPVSDVVRESIRRYVAVERFRGLRRKVLPFAEAQGLLTDEDVFKAIS
jgi:predicted transcriptional regulator